LTLESVGRVSQADHNEFLKWRQNEKVIP